MEEYDPLAAPDPEQWLSLDEGERIALVGIYHEDADVDLPNGHLHAVIHAIVENQAALADEVRVREALQRLLAEGLDRHDAIHAIGAVLTDHLLTITGPEPTTDTPGETYFDNLRFLTAEQWRSTADSPGAGGIEEPSPKQRRRRRHPRPKRPHW